MQEGNGRTAEAAGSAALLARVALQRRVLFALAIVAVLMWLIAAGGALLARPAERSPAGMGATFAAAVLLGLLLYGTWRMDGLLRRVARGVLAQHERELQFRTLADHLPDPLVRFDREGRHLYANAAVERATGLPPQAFIGRTNAEMGMPEANVSQWLATLDRVLATGRTESLSFTYEGPQGVREWESLVVPEPGIDGLPATVLVLSRDLTDSRQTEAALRMSEQRFRLAASFGQVWDWNILTGAVALPEAFWRDLGHEPPSPPYRLEMLEALMHADDRPALRRALGEHLARRRPYDLEFRAYAADGSEHWFRTQGQAVWDESGRATYMAGTTFDITERKRGEAEMRIKEAAFESAINGIALADLSGRLTYVNPAFCRLWGLTLAEAVGRPAVEFWQSPERAAEVMGVVAAEGRWVGEMAGVRAGGAVIDAEVSAVLVRDASGAPLCLMGSFEDITQRKAAEAALRRMNVELEQRVQDRTAELVLSEARYRTIFELVPVAIGEEDWSAVQRRLAALRVQGVDDLPDYCAAHPEFLPACMREVRLGRMNRRLRELHESIGWPTDCASLADVYGGPENLPSFAEEVQALWDGHTLYHAKKSVGAAGARQRSLLLSLALPATDGDGLALVAIVDISEVDRLNAELDASLVRLKRINRELETFTYSVSHDLKAPLRGIDGYSRLLLRDHAERLDEEARGFLANICQASQQMGQLIDDLLAYSRLERRSLAIGALALGDIVRAVISTFADEFARRGVALHLDLPPDLPAWGDAQGISTALQNLVENALKFTRDAEHPAVAIRATRTGEGVRLSVQDNGLGFDMKFHDRIFEIFQRLHRAEDYPGTGVGLAIVRKAMERMGGRAWAESAPGRGATFHLQLPPHP